MAKSIIARFGFQTLFASISVLKLIRSNVIKCVRILFFNFSLHLYFIYKDIQQYRNNFSCKQKEVLLQDIFSIQKKTLYLITFLTNCFQVKSPHASFDMDNQNNLWNKSESSSSIWNFLIRLYRNDWKFSQNLEILKKAQN